MARPLSPYGVPADVIASVRLANETDLAPVLYEMNNMYNTWTGSAVLGSLYAL